MVFIKMAMILPKRLKLTQRVLRREAKPVTFEHVGQLMMLSTAMHDFMTANDGIGLAATQVGIARRMFVMNVEGRARTCINPEALWPTEDQTVRYREGCLSFPDEFVETERPRKILARYQNVHGEWVEEELEELDAVCYQHELDHLNGITMHARAI